jgi:predicted nucleic acid-binding protein
VFTVDASVWVNAYSPSEPQQPSSLAFLTELFTSDTTVIVPTLLPVEVAGVIARTRGDSDLAQKIAAALRGLPFLRWVPLDDSFAEQAWQLAANHRLRGADAIYATVALLHSCDLVSLDNEHLSRLAGVVRTISPSEALVQVRGQRPKP